MTTFLKHFTAALLVLLCFHASASHNRSGEIVYQRIAPFATGNGTPVYNYLITVIKYFDNGPNVGDRCADTVYFGDGNKALVQRINGTNSCASGCAHCGEIINNDPNYMVKLSTYTVTHTYSGPGDYIVSSTDPNRSAGVANIPNSDQVPFCIQSLIHIDPVDRINSSPMLTNPPIYQGSYGGCYYFNASAYDAEGDSLSYELTPCLSAPGQTATGFTYPPVSANGSFSIDPISGLLTWCQPPVLGVYNIAVRIREWRKQNCGLPAHLIGYVISDMQIVINKTNIAAAYTLSAQAGGCVVAGNTYSASISINTSATGSVVAYLYGSPKSGNAPVAVLSPSSSASASLSSSLTWQTTCFHARRQPQPIDVMFTLGSNGGKQYVYQHLGIKVVPPAPKINAVAQQTSKVTLYWKKIITCSPELNGFYIYRKIGANSWTHAPCETGVPASSGFQMIGFAPATDTSFADIYLWNVPDGSTGNYIVTTLMNDCAESFADSTITLSLVVGMKDEELGATTQVFPNPFTNALKIILDVNYTGKVESAIYAADGKIVFAAKHQAARGEVNLQLSDLAPGLYTLQLKTEKGTVYRKLLRE